MKEGENHKQPRTDSNRLRLYPQHSSLWFLVAGVRLELTVFRV